jgi:serine/threonine-protein kinase
MARAALSPPEADLRALDLFERLAAYPGRARFRQRLLRNESAEVLARLARIEAGHAARAAMPTQAPEHLVARQIPPPARIGPFRVATRIGQGGMGDVWRGERDDGLFDQVVAIKLIHAHLGSRAIQAFDAERRILARLEHPDIVRLIDGGIADNGLPYLIMDYVEGAPIDEAVASLPLRARLAVFEQTAKVVAFAHGRMVAHADIKPSNILVDNQGRVRLLDFGIAGLLTEEDGERPSVGAMTREFCSPQRLAGAPPSIADDVYALGRLLAVIVDDLADDDLAAIVAMATVESEAARYGAVSALTADLERWRTGKPVAAREDSAAYRARKFVARHRLGVVASGLAIAALLAMTITAQVAQVRAERARAEAAARFDDARETALYLLFTLMDQLEAQPNSLALRGEVARVAQHYLDRLSHSPHAPPEVRVEAARGLIRLAEVQGVPDRSNLGDPVVALRNLDRALAILDTTQAPDAPALRVASLIDGARIESFAEHNVDQALSRLARADAILAANPQLPPLLKGRALTERAAALRWRNDFAGQLAPARAALAILPKTPDLDSYLERAKATDILALATYYAIGAKVSVAPYRDTVALLETARRLYPASRLAPLRLARARWQLGSTLLQLNQVPEALALMTSAVSDLEQMVAFDRDDMEAARLLQQVEADRAEALTYAHRIPEGIALMKANVAERRAWLARRPAEPRRLRDLAIAVEQLGDIQTRNGYITDGCRSYVEFRGLGAALNKIGDFAQMDMADTMDDLAAQERKYCSGAGARPPAEK